MGSVESYTTVHGKRYRIRYRDSDRRSKEKGAFRTKREAEDYLASVVVAIMRGDYVDPKDSRLTVSEAGASGSRIKRI